MILRISVSDADYTDKLVKSLKNIGDIIHRQSFITKPLSQYLVSDYRAADENSEYIRTILNKNITDIGKEDKQWFMGHVGGVILEFFHNSYMKDFEYINEHLAIEMTDRFIERDENKEVIYIFIFPANISTSTFTIIQ